MVAFFADDAGTRAQQQKKCRTKLLSFIAMVSFLQRLSDPPICCRTCLRGTQIITSCHKSIIITQHCCPCRWCVTGTPISRGLEDLQGLAAFLRLNPWADKQWWNTALQRPTEAGDPTAFARLLHVLRPALGGIMWRSAKKDVAGELQLPVQSCSITHLALSAVERHWYTRQHQVRFSHYLSPSQKRGLALSLCIQASVYPWCLNMISAWKSLSLDHTTNLSIMLGWKLHSLSVKLDCLLLSNHMVQSDQTLKSMGDSP